MLEPAAVADLLQTCSPYGFNGKAVNERRSFVRARASSSSTRRVTIVDDPLLGGCAGLRSTPRARPRRRLDLVEAGSRRAVTHDRRTAAEAGRESTGHAIERRPRAVRRPACPAHRARRRSAPTATGPAADRDATLAARRASAGCWSPTSGTPGVLDPRTLVITGLTRNGVWLIEDGEVTAPVRNFRFTQSYPQALAPGAVLGVGRRQPGAGTRAERLVRHAGLHLAGWNITGGASG